MSKFSENIEKKEDKKVKDRTRREKLASYFFDLSKVTYTVLVVGLLVSILQEEDYMNIPLNILVVIGVLAAITFAKIGNNLFK